MNLEGSKILVTGGAGLIGSHVTDQLLAECPEEIVAFDKDFSRLSENRSPELNYDSVRLVSGDLTRPDEVREVLEGVDFVVHAASLLTRNAAENLRSGFDVNILGTFNVLEACAASKVKKVIYSSSISLYGHPVARPMTEEHPFNTETLYGAGKVSSELLLRVFKKMKGLDYVALRYAPVYGPRQHYRGNINQYIPECFDRIDQGLAPVIYGDGSEPIDFVYVGDVARANVHALKSPVTGEAFNIGTGMVTMIRASSVKDLIALAKAQPGKLSFASSGTGSSIHLAGEMLRSMAGVDMLHVPYKGAASAMFDLLGGHVQLMFDNVATSLPHIKAGTLRPLAVTMAKRTAALPAVPTMEEAGLPGYEMAGWIGLVAPKGTAKDIVDRLYAEVVRIAKIPELQEKMTVQGVDLMGSTPQEFLQVIRKELPMYAKLMKDAGMKPE